ncbi:---NA--- [Pelobates cultripes]|uniref:---NA n=1 Tax=Pelobates cultripes TaxID=61616 RepID=A0AAD1SVR4_PELCU|nr:---NA--- [Pelobates cultripes]
MPDDKWVVDRAHMALRARRAEGSVPRDVIIHFHYFFTNEAIINSDYSNFHCSYQTDNGTAFTQSLILSLASTEKKPQTTTCEKSTESDMESSQTRMGERTTACVKPKVSSTSKPRTKHEPNLTYKTSTKSKITASKNKKPTIPARFSLPSKPISISRPKSIAKTTARPLTHYKTRKPNKTHTKVKPKPSSRTNTRVKRNIDSQINHRNADKKMPDICSRNTNITTPSATTTASPLTGNVSITPAETVGSIEKSISPLEFTCMNLKYNDAIKNRTFNMLILKGVNRIFNYFPYYVTSEIVMLSDVGAVKIFMYLWFVGGPLSSQTVADACAKGVSKKDVFFKGVKIDYINSGEADTGAKRCSVANTGTTSGMTYSAGAGPATDTPRRWSRRSDPSHPSLKPTRACAPLYPPPPCRNTHRWAPETERDSPHQGTTPRVYLPLIQATNPLLCRLLLPTPCAWCLLPNGTPCLTSALPLSPTPEKKENPAPPLTQQGGNSPLPQAEHQDPPSRPRGPQRDSLHSPVWVREALEPAPPLPKSPPGAALPGCNPILCDHPGGPPSPTGASIPSAAQSNLRAALPAFCRTNIRSPSEAPEARWEAGP